MAQATIATTVTGLQGHPVATTPPNAGQALVFNGTNWTPDNSTFLSAAGGTVTGALTVNGGVSVGSNATTAQQVPPLTQVNSISGDNIGRNYIDNAQFVWNQRGSASYSPPANTPTYTMDRWACSVGPSPDALTVTQAAASDADRAAVGDEIMGVYCSCAFTGGTAATNQVVFQQRMENVRALANKTITISFWAYSPTSLRVGPVMVQNFGSGGSPSPQILIGGTAITLTTGWARYSQVFNMPSVAGKTLGNQGPYGSSYTGMVFYLSAPPANTNIYGPSGNLGAQSGTVNFWGMQVELGGSMTPFEHRDIETDVARIQRFFTNSAQIPTVSTQAGGSYGGWWPVPFYYPVMMRMAPTVTFAVNAGSGTYGAALGVGSNQYGGNIVPQTAATAAGQYQGVSYSASADL